MNVVGIIAEYNPFHTGHAYQIAETRKRLHADCIIAIMSGNYVQRGEPALYNKQLRAHMALLSGVDLVIELPMLYATDGAKDFARGGVKMCQQLPQVSALSFGMECDDIHNLQVIANLLTYESDEYQLALQKYMKNGEQMGLARMHACEEIYGSSIDVQILSSPNNILALEYLMAMNEFQVDFDACGIPRRGAGYHDTSPSDGFASATQLRHQILNGASIDSLAPYMHKDAISLLQKHSHPLQFDDFSALLQYQITQESNFCKYVDVDEELNHRIQSLSKDGKIRTATEWICDLKTKNRTQSQVSRALLHILLGITKELKIQAVDAPYIQVLGMNANGREYLHSIKKDVDLPILTEASSGYARLSESGKRIFDLQARSTKTYQNVYFHKYGWELPDEYRTHPLLLS